MSHTYVDKMMDALKSGELASPVEKLVGMGLVEHGRGEATYQLDVRPEHANPMGMVQGGIASIMADAAMAMAMTTTLTNDEMRNSAVTTVDLFSRFIRPVKASKVKLLRAEARVLRGGRQLVWAECDLSADGELVGKFNATGIRVAFEQKDHTMQKSSGE
ncbi:MAG: PaaI family thioesterase [Acidimicrobiia bacterium]|nr:PaaI family thioesterase [Acidimicrobiia bacterium]